MPKYQIEVNDKGRVEFLEKLAREHNLSVEQIIRNNLPTPPEPEPPSFDFIGTVMRAPALPFGMLYVVFDQEDGCGQGCMAASDVKRSMKKWLLRGARVEGRAKAPHRRGNVSRILSVAPEGKGMLERDEIRSLRQGWRDFLEHRSWRADEISRNTAIERAHQLYVKRQLKLQPTSA